MEALASGAAEQDTAPCLYFSYIYKNFTEERPAIPINVNEESHFQKEECIFGVFLKGSIFKVADLGGISGSFGGPAAFRRLRGSSLDWHGGRNSRMQWVVLASPGFFPPHERGPFSWGPRFATPRMTRRGWRIPSGAKARNL